MSPTRAWSRLRLVGLFSIAGNDVHKLYSHRSIHPYSRHPFGHANSVNTHTGGINDLNCGVAELLCSVRRSCRTPQRAGSSFMRPSSSHNADIAEDDEQRCYGDAARRSRFRRSPAIRRSPKSSATPARPTKSGSRGRRWKSNRPPMTGLPLRQKS